MKIKNNPAKLLALLVALSWASSTPTIAQEVPDLFVCFYVEGMQLSLLQNYRSALANDNKKGFEQFISQGVIYPNVSWDFIIDSPTSALASIVSGSYPRNHGIGFGTDIEEVLKDSENRGVFTNQRVSAQKLSYTTFSDVVREVTNGNASVYSIAPFEKDAIITGGKQASAAFWLDNTTGKWVSNSFYPNALHLLSTSRGGVQQLKAFDVKNDTNKRIVWEPLFSSNDSIQWLPYKQGVKTFKHSFANSNEVHWMKQSALTNNVVGEMACYLLQQLAQQKDKNTSVLHIILNCAVAGKQGYYSPYSAEALDAYYRANRVVAEVVTLANHLYGKRHVATALVGIPNPQFYYSTTTKPTGGNGNPKNIITSDHIKALVNLYLSAIYGKENWVDKVQDGFLFLNRGLIAKKQINLQTLQQQLKLFISEIDGVAQAYPLTGTNFGDADPISLALWKSIPPSTTADIYIELGSSSAWKNNTLQCRQHNYPYLYASSSFVMLSIPTLEGSIVHRVVNFSSFASTINYIFRIRPPAGCYSNPMDEVICFTKKSCSFEPKLH